MFYTVSQAWKVSGILLMRHDFEVTMTVSLIVSSNMTLPLVIQFSAKLLHKKSVALGIYTDLHQAGIYTYCCCQVFLSWSRSS